MPITPEAEQMLVLSAQQGNILAINSSCGSHCVFCSHHNNPPGVRALSVGMRRLHQVKPLFKYLDPNKDITIGESATRIIEGEPTMNPEFREIITEIRKVFPRTTVAVTTNGHYLTEDLVRHLAKTGNVLINLSLNSATVEGRRILMGDKEKTARTAIDSVKYMKKQGVPFHGSLVAMPNLTGYDDIKNSIEYLADNGALSVRVFAPAFSRFVKKDVFPDADTIMEELREYVPKLSETLPCPVLLEPSMVDDLRSLISGVIKGSPAWEDGMRRGDEIIMVDGRKPRCRVEAFRMLEPPGRHNIIYIRSGKKRQTGLHWSEPGGSGVTMEYDFEPARAEYIKNAVVTAPGHVLSMSSEFAYPMILDMLDRFEVPRDKITSISVRNETFGGTIRAAGLLCVSDYLAAFEAFVSENEWPGAVMIPSESFDYIRTDLKGAHLGELQAAFRVPTILV